MAAHFTWERLEGFGGLFIPRTDNYLGKHFMVKGIAHPETLAAPRM